MAQWQALLRLDSALQRRVSQVYERRFRREIRHNLCALIESHDWDLAAVDENRAAMCFQALLVYLEEQWNRSLEESNILQGPDYSGMREYLLMNFGDEPMNLAAVLSECLQEEKKILSSASEAQGCQGESTVDQQWRQLDNKINELKRQTLEVTKEIKSLEDLNEKLSYIQETWKNQVEKNVGLAQSHAVVEEECVKQANFIMRTKQMLLQQLAHILNTAGEIVPTLTGVELPEWKRRQQMACLGNPVDTSLDLLEKWFTAVAEVLIGVHKQLQKLQGQNVAEMRMIMMSLLVNLLENALVVEKQPIMASLPQRPLILKTGVRFMATVRFLANLPEFKCLLKVKPVFDKDVEETMTIKGFRHFDFSKGDSKVMDVDVPGGGLVAEFGLMSLKETKAKAKGTSETRLGVTEELHVIKFVTEFQHAGLQCKMEASSLPVVVISSTNQIPSAWGSIMWYNMLCTSEPQNLSLFVDPPPLTWTQLSQVLNWQFLSVGQRGLDENQLLMLRDKIVDDPDDSVQWCKFSKNDGAWIWIDGILDLIRKHLVDLWRDGFIMGFVSRQRTRALLQEKQTGTFLLRFSESNKDGAITFSWVEHSNGEAHVHAVEPYTKLELSVMCLPDIIYLYSLRAERSTTRNPLLYLYPDIPKDAAFGRYCKSSAMLQPKKVVDGYVDRTLIPMSVYPTPPPSPPRESPIMDVDMNIYSDEDTHQLIQELFSDLLCFSEHPDHWTSPTQSDCVTPSGSF
uniref:signal transducer and activator of transcription 1-alpha/beta-like isoform X2 n=1 Tax=Scatophagus argus TaxID=75038 RepID=UPI001ED85B36|nr:signal transducer and activator of transcription 1-alpha/beta-like isoform X2 [Scatophagus argus]